MIIRCLPLLAFVAAALCGGCGAAVVPPAAGPADSDEATAADLAEASDLHRQLRRLDDALGPASELGGRCPRARDLLERLCGNADRICDIAARHPEDPDLARLCADSAGRCDARSAQVERTCPASDVDPTG
jgi:hypothetical protein